MSISVINPQSFQNLADFDSRDYIIIKNARVNNLKNLCVAIPKRKLVVITGLSGSGKSSLAYDTLYAEGHRRYVESLSSYARQFLERIDKPDVDYIKGIAPAIIIDQKVNNYNPRSTVGTNTEIYDYLRLLFARTGKTYSPLSGSEVKKYSTTDVNDYLHTCKNNSRFSIYSKIELTKEDGPINSSTHQLINHLESLIQKGITKIKINNQIELIEDLLKKKSLLTSHFKLHTSNFSPLIDRVVIKTNDIGNRNRISDSISIAFNEGIQSCFIEDETGNMIEFSSRFEVDGIKFDEPSPHLFNFNSSYGACSLCNGFGTILGIDEDLVIPDKTLSVYQSAIACWRGLKMKIWLNDFLQHAHKFDFPVHRPYHQLNPEQKKLLFKGNEYFKGINEFFKFLEAESYKIQYRVMLSRYRGKTICTECNGARLRKEAFYVKLKFIENGIENLKSINELLLLPIKKLKVLFENIILTDFEKKISTRVLIEINNRLDFLTDVGLDYLTLNRSSNTLSGGESQRIKIAFSLGSSLVGSMYILDEPSIGLHSRDTGRLIKVLNRLRDLGNTVIVVEHDENIIMHSDHILDLGLMAGVNGGKLIFQGNYDEIIKSEDGLTGKYLSHRLTIPNQLYRRKAESFIQLKSCTKNNLKNFNLDFPLNCFTVVSGVSGSGKTTLVKDILYPNLKLYLSLSATEKNDFELLSGNVQMITGIELVDQKPIGRSSRSNPATYVKAYDYIRELYAETNYSLTHGLKPSDFSFNVPGGRCEVCQGEGYITVEMQFMADLHLKCDECHGKRFTDEILECKFNSINISELLSMTIDEVLAFLENIVAHKSENKQNINDKNRKQNTRIHHLLKNIIDRLKPLSDVGLGYLALGQSSATLSGGEAQRVKLGYYLGQLSKEYNHTIFIFDEPTTGLHFHDVEKLLRAIQALVNQGNTVIVIEHNLDVIKSADWVIDLGPEGGEEGGYLLFTGTPEEMIKLKDNSTAKYLERKMY